MRLILLWLTLLVSILFLVLPYSEERFDWFPASDQKLSLAMHVWFICDKLVMVTFASLILNLSDKYKLALSVFLGVQVLKLGDYLICYNELWGEIQLCGRIVPVTANTVGAIAFTLAMIYEFVKSYGNNNRL